MALVVEFHMTSRRIVHATPTPTLQQERGPCVKHKAIVLLIRKEHGGGGMRGELTKTARLGRPKLQALTCA